MFHVGDLIVYGSEGVCRVDAIGVPEIFDTDQEREYYTLSPLYRQGTVYTPVDTKVFMRPVISRQEAMDLIRSIPNIDDGVIENRNIRILSEKYQETMKSHNCEDLMRVVKSVNHKKRLMDERGKKLGQVDEKYYKKAKDLLHGEFAVVLDIPKEDVGNYIENQVKSLREQAD
ncbi:MAG: CarD family transcriptional regulator [Anaerovoracaceae bacterium]|nr:CarD family transcriptional regulator [Bacillota bacterium]MDY2671195.1 CarD family transcriptional regulator [Anaerovoracaceae bacterium]